MKQCANCKKWRDESEFNWRYKSQGVLQSVCRDCSRARSKDFYESQREDEIDRSYEITKRRRIEAQRFMYEYLSYRVCADCREYDYSVLTFDHVRGEKKMEVSQIVQQGYSIEAFMSEVAKCEVVCFNCHMRREAKRKSGGRFRRFWPKFPWEK
jgi:hypothetical protein